MWPITTLIVAAAAAPAAPSILPAPLLVDASETGGDGTGLLATLVPTSLGQAVALTGEGTRPREPSSVAAPTGERTR